MKPTLLIVDDILSVREKLQASLSDEFEVVGLASSGSEAVEFVKQKAPDLVLMDLVMPLMSGIDATRAIVALAHPAPRIVILSALDDENVVIRALEAGAAEYLIKPVSESKIREALRVLAREAA